MSKKNKLPTTDKNKVLSLTAFNMIRKEGKCFDGFVKDEKGNYMFVISKPEYQFTSNASGSQIDSDIYYSYVILDLQPDGIGCWVWRKTKKHLFFDRNLEASQAAVTKEYGTDVHYIPESSSLKVKDPVTKEITETFTVFIGEDRKGYVVDKNGVKLPNDRTVKTDDGTIIFATSDDSLDPSTLYRNRFGSNYIGEFNPRKYSGGYDYSFAPESRAEWGAYFHDLRYDKAKAEGKSDAFTNTSVFWADAALTGNSLIAMPLDLLIPLKTTGGSSREANFRANLGISILFGGISIFKAVKTPVDKAEKHINQKTSEAMMKNYSPPMPYSPFK